MAIHFPWLPIVFMITFAIHPVFSNQSETSRGRERIQFPYSIPIEIGEASYRIDVNTTKKRPFTRAVYGFNANFISHFYDYGDSLFQERMGVLKPGSLRFPGGTVGNWYDWRNDGFSGWPENAPSWFVRAVQSFKSSKKKYGYEGYARLVKKYDIEPVIMMNILAQTAEDAVAWLDRMKEDGLDVRHVELGNEVYFRDQNNEKTKSVRGYIELCKEFTGEIRKKYKDVKIGVCGAPMNDRWKAKWNGLLSKETFYDAFVHHEYVQISDRGKGADSFRNRLVLLLGAERAVKRIVDESRRLSVPAPLWITEWNVATSRMRILKRTGALGIFLAGFYMSMLDYPEHIQLACCHRLSDAFTITEKGKARQYVGFPVWKLISEATQQSRSICESSVTPFEQEGWRFQFAQCTSFEGDDTIRILFVNKLPLAKKVTLQVNGTPWKGTGLLSFFSVSSPSEMPEIDRTHDGIKTKQFTDTLQIDPYSINLIVIPKEVKQIEE
jgi:hypothetical protein